MRPRPAALWVALAATLAGSCGKAEKRPDIPALMTALKSSRPEVRTRAVLDILAVGEPAALPLSQLLDDPEPRTRIAAAQALWGLGPKAKAAVPHLAAALRDPQVEVRAAAAMLCEALGPVAAPTVPALTQALRDPDWNVRQHAAAALGSIGPAAVAAVPVLVDIAKDDFLKDVATEALRRIQGPR